MSSLNQPVQRTFVPGETEVGGYLNAAVRDAVNAILNPPHFRASITNGATLTANANIAWPSVEDNYSGWNSSSNYWVVPATWSGLYTVEVRFKWNGTAPTSAPAINVFKNGTKVLASANASSTSGFAGVSLTDRLRVVAGDQIAVQIGNAGFVCQTDTGDNNTFNFGFYCM